MIVCFSTKKGLLSTHQSAVKEAPTVFSRLPSLMAADKPCLLLQPSLRGSPDCLELHNLSLHVWASYYVPFFWAFSNNIGDPKASGHPI